MVVLSGQISAKLAKVSALAARLDTIIVDDSTISETVIRSPQQRRLTSAEQADVAGLYDAGSSMNDLARLFSVHRSAIVRALQEQGVPRRTRGLTDEEAAEAGRLYQEGWSLLQLRNKFGYSDSAVTTALRRVGIQTRPRNGWPSSEPDIRHSPRDQAQ